MIFVDWFEPGYKAGGPIQSCKNLSQSLYNEIDIYLVCSDRDLGDDSPYPGIVPDAWNNFEQKIKVYYCTTGRMSLSLIGKLLDEIAPQCIYVNGMFSAYYSIFPVYAARTRKIKTIVAPRGMLQNGAIQFGKFKKLLFLSAARYTGLYRNSIFHATDEQEKLDILRFFPGTAGIEVIGNFFRVEEIPRYFTPKTKGMLKIIFLSRVSPKKNLFYLLQALQGVEKREKIYLTIAGEVDDQAYWKKCKSLIEQLPSHIMVNRRDAVPNKDLTSFYRDFHVFALPSFGENFGHAILEAMLCSKPVIISDKTPWQHLEDCKAGFSLPLDRPKQFLAAITKMVDMDEEEYNEWSGNAHAYARRLQGRQQQLKQQYLALFL
jgi:glycosyltransferase involved in cell wall biosynthesis